MAHRSRVGLRNTQVPGPFYSGNFFNKDPDLLFHRFHPEEYIVLPLKVSKKGHFKYYFSTLQLKESLAPFGFFSVIYGDRSVTFIKIFLLSYSENE